jgi:hypothetical protein
VADDQLEQNSTEVTMNCCFLIYLAPLLRATSGVTGPRAAKRPQPDAPPSRRPLRT